MTNERLHAALKQAGLEIDDLAEAVPVEERELWPDAQPPAPDTSRLELVGAYDVLAPDWRALLKDARERIEVLDLTSGFALVAPLARMEARIILRALGSTASAICASATAGRGGARSFTIRGLRELRLRWTAPCA